MRRALSLDSSPSLSAPLRFFVSAPIYVLIAGGLLLWSGPLALASRWSPFALALTHLFTLGALGNAMLGALIQILPVATGVHVYRPVVTATVVHALLTIGALSLSTAFVFSVPALYALSAVVLVGAFLWFLTAFVIGFFLSRKNRQKGSEDVLLSTRLALGSLFVTVVVGGMLAGAMSGAYTLPLPRVTHIHVVWGLSGWIGLLVAGIAYQVIPMFLVTEPYPLAFTRWFAPGVFGLVLVLSLAAGFLPDDRATVVQPLVGNALGAAFTALGGMTLYLLATRKRAQADATTLFWRLSMASLVCCWPVWFLAVNTGRTAWFVTFGVLVLVGFAWSAVNGMLYKILPFLLWYHLQASLPMPMNIVPKVKDIIEDRTGKRQFAAHLVAVLLLVAASQWPAPLARVAGLALIVSAVWLGVVIVNALKCYRRVSLLIESKLAKPAADARRPE
ncbi:hypothetical protein [Paraburkholderia sp.]|uniref:hypothetical protein n=1 Tax=Paraburkholderia sp. TaxID=1926495 RepID=UPI0025EE41BC|nr:hypothetical protein [Paraburkholderia sp.]